MRVLTDKTLDRPIDPQLQKADEAVASHPGAGLLLAALFGILVGIWIKRK